jgi:hypothetical protein
MFVYGLCDSVMVDEELDCHLDTARGNRIVRFIRLTIDRATAGGGLSKSTAWSNFFTCERFRDQVNQDKQIVFVERSDLLTFLFGLSPAVHIISAQEAISLRRRELRHYFLKS